MSRSIALSNDYGWEVMANNQAVVDQSDILLLGVRPDVVGSLATEVDVKPGTTIISLVAGMKKESLEDLFPTAIIVRVMLSYAAEINSTTVVIYPNNTDVVQFLAPLGTSVLLEDEDAFDLATVAACMNGWFYFWLQDLQQWFVGQGLPADRARQLVLSNMQDCLASAGQNPRMSLGSMGRAIATPGTYTAMGVELLDAHGASLPWGKACNAVLHKLKTGSESSKT